MNGLEIFRNRTEYADSAEAVPRHNDRYDSIAEGAYDSPDEVSRLDERFFHR